MKTSPNWHFGVKDSNACPLISSPLSVVRVALLKFYVWFEIEIDLKWNIGIAYWFRAHLPRIDGFPGEQGTQLW